MVNRNIFRAFLFGAAFMVALLLAAPQSHAAMQTFEKEYTYTASELDSKSSCRAIALEQVKRILLQELGVYVESVFNDKASTDGRTKDEVRHEITTLSAGVASTEVVEEKWDGTTYWLKARIKADPDDVAKKIEALRQDKQKVAELEESRKRAEELSRELERMRKDLDTTKSALAKAEQSRKYNDAGQELSASDWYDKGSAFMNFKQYDKAIEAFSKAISLSPQYSFAYLSRGFVYSELGNIKQAIEDYDKVVELNPKLSLVFYSRGEIYGRLGNYQLAINDFDRAIGLDPNPPYAYYLFFNRGTMYGQLGNTARAIEDFSKAIEIDPKSAESYYSRSVGYGKLHDIRGLQDLKTAARLGFQPAQDWFKSQNLQW